MVNKNEVQAPPAQASEVIFQPVQTGRVSGAIVRQAESAIISGRLQVGERLPPERELAEQFGVSRVTVRDALRVLEAKGLIRIRAGAKGGAFVTTPPPTMLREGLANLLILSDVTAMDVTEVRLALEVEAVRLACTRATDDDIRALLDICTRTESALQTGDYDIRLSAEFHVRLAAASHNPAFALVVEALYGPMLVSLAEAKEGSQDYGIGPDRNEHRDIVTAISSRDEGQAVEIMQHHLKRQTQRLNRRLNGLKGGS
ncbi:FadR/GntR family transcriptional regulator [Egicoccus halophilus]|uniref:GntR family transcriptional regulator n=1 Tax=Egicoccus halophilus TaxID=1670830 RepID=A0A8J3EQJ3_9ACTN|nr:FadR/GntR family transcriptional regulator [Egicoccus halophilus]GGI02380.1 GntR family transcriptional regulator [Egicoccus halophilus]